MQFPKPWNIQIELVRGCNLSCEFCAIHCVPKEKLFMSKETLMNTLAGVQDFDPLRVEFAMRGEPTLHPELAVMVGLTRGFMPKSQITLTTNGIKLTKELAVDFFRAGGNIIVVDCYGTTFEKYSERFVGLPVVDFYEGKFNPWHRHPANEKKLVLMRDMTSVNGKKAQRQIINQAGNIDYKRVAKYGVYPLKKALEKQCVHPFREVTVFADGQVSICCRDWRNEHTLFNANEKDIAVEWTTNPEWMRVRKLLQSKDRASINICKRCDFHGGFRIGLLPKV